MDEYNITSIDDVPIIAWHIQHHGTFLFTYSMDKDIAYIFLISSRSVGVFLGPAGLLAGLLAGGKKKQITFVCKFKDGRKFLATVPSKVYMEISASVF
ncbi:MAG: hypothetical protein GKR92_05395 [Gammaproteobacteria bacterium]|nr:MAG: hypothetical protein GKR92_05395 [Gammaproteobacteria bacterium]